MNNLIEYIGVASAGYLIGSIPWAFIIGKINGIDIRRHGSRNVGATNVNRVLGKKWGVSCFVLDFLKGLLPILVIEMLARNDLLTDADLDVVLVSASAVTGHMWPIFLAFKGGKGISTIAGIILALAPLSLLTAGAAWVLIFHFSRYVSLASVSAALLLPITAWTFSAIGWTTTPFTVLIMLSALSALAIFRHRVNIKRLLSGTENKFERKSEQ
ncbi:MAG: glycerol-3-phosphate 1-O-acyltransferase PlsY [Kiritimatiellaeota bacterium]|nr:glycerol-3-phosphate 1-O-acyltransferase PlsY [Kiritimatiellota bacterium]